VSAAPDTLSESAWADATLVAALLAVDPACGGVVLRGGAGAARDAWLALLRRLRGPSLPWRRLPGHIADERLLGGLDLVATLAAGRPVVQRGLLSESDGGTVIDQFNIVRAEIERRPGRAPYRELCIRRHGRIHGR
jgi:hypothetical protein